MQSTMTERQFRRELVGLPGFDFAPLIDRVVFVAREAGLEFAPEPVADPPLGQLEMVGRTVLYVGAAPYFDVEMQLATAIRVLDNPAMSAMHERDLGVAVARSNAYPGLFRAAEMLLAAIKEGPNVGYSMESLRDELAKGPK